MTSTSAVSASSVNWSSLAAPVGELSDASPAEVWRCCKDVEREDAVPLQARVE